MSGKKFLREWWLTLAVVVVLGGAFLFLRTSAGPVRTWADLQEQLRAGQPVIVEVYSNT